MRQNLPNLPMRTLVFHLAHGFNLKSAGMVNGQSIIQADAACVKKKD